MYVAVPETKSQPSGANTALAASAALGERKGLSWDASMKAVLWTRRYAPHLGWMPHARQIAHKLGITSANPDVWSFVQALADWQARHGGFPNGVMQGEWHDVLTRP